jgi:hypothetical protein
MGLRAKAPEFAESYLEITCKNSAHQLTMRGSVRQQFMRRSGSVFLLRNKVFVSYHPTGAVKVVYASYWLPFKPQAGRMRYNCRALGAALVDYARGYRPLW